MEIVGNLDLPTIAPRIGGRGSWQGANAHKCQRRNSGRWNWGRRGSDHSILSFERLFSCFLSSVITGLLIATSGIAI
jgi:hypothetical protein